MEFLYRKARLSDVENLERLIQLSGRSINSNYYSELEINATLGKAWTVDRQLIIDCTYWIVETPSAQTVGCGGWSKRRLLFGKSKDEPPLDNELVPGIDPARIRAFFVHPNFIRMGIGRELLKICENEAKNHGFDSLELVATLSGEKLYSSCGFTIREFSEIDLDNGMTNKVVMMSKPI